MMDLFEVTLIQILTVLIKTLLTLGVIIMAIVSGIFSFVLSFIFWTLLVLIIVAGSLSLPMIFAFVVFLVVSIAWDEGAKPVMEIIQTAVNFVVELWNSVVRALKSFGISLDEGSGFEQAVPTFWEFLKNILYNMVWKPIESGLKGAIIRQ